nr:hypothetical protein [Janibacter limosus]
MALFVGTTVGAFSSVFIATPLLVDLRRKDPEVVKLAKEAQKYRARQSREPALATAGAPASAAVSSPVTSPQARETGSSAPSDDAPDASGEAQTVTGRKVHKYAQSSGPRNQPKKTPRNRRGKE